MIGKLRSSI